MNIVIISSDKSLHLKYMLNLSCATIAFIYSIHLPTQLKTFFPITGSTQCMMGNNAHERSVNLSSEKMAVMMYLRLIAGRLHLLLRFFSGQFGGFFDLLKLLSKLKSQDKNTLSALTVKSDIK